MRQSSAFLSGIAVASAFFLGLGMQSISGRSPEDGGGGTYAISSDVREFLQHVSMVDLPIDYQGHTRRAVRIEGINVQIVNGLGTTNSTNAVGNLIIGYNELDGTNYYDRRTGSHNIVSGDANGYLGVAGLVLGWGNFLGGSYSSILCGSRNEVHQNSHHSVITGGAWNTTKGTWCVVNGGQLNSAEGERSWVAGGESNTATAIASAACGGSGNKASGVGAFASGGRGNTAVGSESTVSGGLYRVAPGTDDWVAGSLWEDQ